VLGERAGKNLVGAFTAMRSRDDVTGVGQGRQI
jgi:hypothetical protein